MPSRLNVRRRSFFTIAAVAVAAAALFAPTASAVTGPRVTTMIAGKAGTLAGPVSAQAHAFVVPVGSAKRRCQVAAGTPLAAFKSTGLVFHMKDFGHCSMKTTDSAGLFVDRINSTSNSGTSGWSFKVNNRAGTAGAADPSGPFGAGPMASGDKVLWFWCVFDANWACQRTLEVVVQPTSTPRESLSISVRAYDDFGSWIPAKFTKVTLGSLSATTGIAGTVTIAAPAKAGRYPVRATDALKGGIRPPAFPGSVLVG